MDDEPGRNLTEWRAARKELPGIWRTLDYEQLDWERGRAAVGWTAAEDYAFATEGGPVVQGGMVTALLDAAMGSACWTVLRTDQGFLTADLRVEFLRSARVGRLVATGTVVRATRRVIFCAADLHDVDGLLLATARCTQVVLPDEHASRRGAT